MHFLAVMFSMARSRCVADRVLACPILGTQDAQAQEGGLGFAATSLGVGNDRFPGSSKGNSAASANRNASLELSLNKVSNMMQRIDSWIIDTRIDTLPSKGLAP